MSRETIDVGRVVAVNVYPVKSMAGQSLDCAKLGWQGLAGDRQFAFQCLDDASGLPWLSGRTYPQLLAYKAFIDGDPRKGVVRVTTPTGAFLPVDAPSLLDELMAGSGRPLRLTQLWRGAYDAAPLSLVTTASIAAVEAMVGRALEPERFRANIVVEALDGKTFPEDRWIGESLIIGDSAEAPRMRINRKDPRCRIVNISPATGQEDPSVLQEIVQQRKNNIGVYASPEFGGVVRKGDIVRILRK